MPIVLSTSRSADVQKRFEDDGAVVIEPTWASTNPPFSASRLESAQAPRRPNRSGPIHTPTLDSEMSAWEAASNEVWDSID